jgi:hypothetical protein
MMRRFAALLALLSVCSCPSTPSPVSPNPLPAPDTASCAAMCDHIGPKGLNCAEGKDVYDSDKPGPVGVPNSTCAQFCQYEQDNGIFVNPKCVAQVPSCEEIEQWRQKACP